MIRFEFDTVFNVRAHKGERRAADGSGRLLKTTVFLTDELEAGFRDIRDIVDPTGHAEIVDVRAFDNDRFKADPLGAVPFYRGTHFVAA
jgi:hypothetical protein